jgi:hypothetical protein
LKGEKPQDLPAVQPNQVQLMKVLDIEAPANILALAAEVIFRVCEGLRTPAPVCAAPPSWGRHPQTFTQEDLPQMSLLTQMRHSESFTGRERLSEIEVVAGIERRGRF